MNPACSVGVIRAKSNNRTKYVELPVEGLRTGVRFPPPPPKLKPQPFSVGVFSCLLAPVPACSRGFLRKPADCANWPLGPFWATFHSLLAILLCGFALCLVPEVRKGDKSTIYKSISYARTIQSVGLWHCLPGGNSCLRSSLVAAHANCDLSETDIHFRQRSHDHEPSC